MTGRDGSAHGCGERHGGRPTTCERDRQGRRWFGELGRQPQKRRWSGQSFCPKALVRVGEAGCRGSGRWLSVAATAADARGREARSE
jgi:hypothetical protein